MCCPIVSGIFGKVLYLIPIKMPPKRYGRFRGYHAYIRLRDYQTAGSPYPPPVYLWQNNPLLKKKRQLRKNPNCLDIPCSQEFLKNLTPVSKKSYNLMSLILLYIVFSRFFFRYNVVLPLDRL